MKAAKKGWLAISLVLCALPACGGGMSQSPGYDHTTEVAMDEDVSLTADQVGVEQQLEEVLSRPEPDCAAACDLSATICELGSRICGLAARNAHSPEIRSRCDDGSQRCERARARVAEVCTCAE